MRVTVLAPLLFVGACTFLDSRNGLVGPPLGADGGLALMPDAAARDDSGPAPQPGDDAATAPPQSDASAGVPADDGAPPSVPSLDSGADGAPDAGGPSPLYGQLLSPLGIAVHSGTLCWVSGDTLRMIQCAAVGGDASTMTTVASQSDDSLVDDAFDVALDDTYWYWSNGSNNQVVRKAFSGGASAQYFTGDGRLSYIVIDGTNLWATDYVAGATGGSIVVGPSGTTSMLIFPGETMAAGVGIYSGSVYWGRAAAGSVSFARESGNTTITRVPTAGQVTGLAIDAAGTTYFVSGDQQVYRLAQGSGTPVLMYDAGASFGDGDLALDATWVYWSEPSRGAIMRMAK